ncbi:MAG: V-type ATPase subunit [Candidatus Wallbacteria bacterium]|nr:V-type ATPase subunit [Candidatus Wallbacteria bacterium]
MKGLSPFYYSYLNARVRARRDRYLSREDLKRSLGSSIPEILSRFRDAASDARIDLSMTRRILARILVDDCHKVISYSPGYARDVGEAYLFRYGIEDLKTVIRIWKSHEEALSYIADQEVLELAGGGPENLSAYPYLKHMPTFCSLLKKIESYSIAELEKALDLDYFRYLAQLLKDFSGEDRRSLNLFLGFQIDVSNIINLLRLKYYYGHSEEDCLGYMFPPVNIPRRDLEALIRKDNLQQAISVLEHTKYSFLSQAPNVPEMERLISFEKEKITTLFLMGNTFNIGLVFASIWMAEVEFELVGKMVEAKFFNHNELIEGLFNVSA